MWILALHHESTRSESKKCYSNAGTLVLYERKNYNQKPVSCVCTLDSGRVAETVMYMYKCMEFNICDCPQLCVCVCVVRRSSFVIRSLGRRRSLLFLRVCVMLNRHFEYSCTPYCEMFSCVFSNFKPQSQSQNSDTK